VRGYNQHGFRVHTGPGVVGLLETAT